MIATHLGLWPSERQRQAKALLGADWLAHPDCREPVILCGDFNALPSSSTCLRLSERLHDAQVKMNGRRPQSTFFGRYPLLRIDHVFVDPRIEVVDIAVPLIICR